MPNVILKNKNGNEITYNGVYKVQLKNSEGGNSQFVYPIGTLNVNSNGTYDVSEKESVNVNVSGGASLNIYYGLDEPVDKSKLWIKLGSEPSKVEIANNIELRQNTMYTNIATLPNAAAGIACGVVGDKCYLFGGSSEPQADGTSVKDYNTIIVFDTKNNSVETLTSVTTPNAYNGMSCGVVNKKCYLFGGNSGTSIYSNKIWVFDTETQTKEILSATLPSGSIKHGCGVVGSYIYLFGGRVGTSITQTSTIYKFNTNTNEGTRLSIALPIAAYGMACGVVGTKCYLFGGRSGSTYLTTINVFDTETDTIRTLTTTLPSNIYDTACGVIGNKIYLFGGGSNLYYIYVFDTETETIEKLNITSAAINLSASGVVGNNIYIFGGKQSNALNSIHKFSSEFEIEKNKLVILNIFNSQKFSIIKTGNINVEIGVGLCLLGNEDNIGEEVKFAIHNGTEWIPKEQNGYTLTLNCAEEILNNETFTYSLDGGQTYNQFTNPSSGTSIITLENVNQIKFKQGFSYLEWLIGTTEGSSDITRLSSDLESENIKVEANTTWYLYLVGGGSSD